MRMGLPQFSKAHFPVTAPKNTKTNSKPRGKKLSIPAEKIVIRHASNLNRQFLAERKAALGVKLAECQMYRRRVLNGSEMAFDMPIPDSLDQSIQQRDLHAKVSRVNHCAELIPMIENALRAIQENKGEYGICVMCGEQIATKRLIAEPWADTCVDCQEKTELTH